MRCCGERLRNFEVFHIVIHIYIFSVTVRNRMRCCGGRLRNLEVRAGTKSDNTNDLVGTFAGPGNYEIVLSALPDKQVFM